MLPWGSKWLRRRIGMPDTIVRLLGAHDDENRREGEVCKTFIHEFDSHPRLQLNSFSSSQLTAFTSHYRSAEITLHPARSCQKLSLCQAVCQAPPLNCQAGHDRVRPWNGQN